MPTETFQKETPVFEYIVDVKISGRFKQIGSYFDQETVNTLCELRDKFFETTKTVMNASSDGNQHIRLSSAACPHGLQVKSMVQYPSSFTQSIQVYIDTFTQEYIEEIKKNTKKDSSINLGIDDFVKTIGDEINAGIEVLKLIKTEIEKANS
jgi:biotin synthase-related radical SAM superfamily protein